MADNRKKTQLNNAPDDDQNEQEAVGRIGQGPVGAPPAAPLDTNYARDTGREPTMDGSPAPADTPVPQFSNEPTTADKVGDVIASGSIMATPAYQQYIANQQKLVALQATPTYTNKRGETVQGFEDKDGRWRSGLKGLIAGAANAFDPRNPVRDWNDLYSRLAGSISAGATGAIVPEWNERAERDNEVARLQQEQQQLKGEIGFQSQMATQEANRADKVEDNRRQSEALVARKRNDFFRRNKSFDPTKATDSQRRELAELGETPMSMGHYDFTKADIRWVNGKAFQWKDGAWMPADLPEKSNEMLVEYTIKDQDGVSSTYLVPQQKAAQFKQDMVRVGMQIDAAKERQAAGFADKDKDRAIKWEQIKQNAAKFRAKTAADLAQKRMAVSKARENGDISEQEAEEILNLLNSNNPDFAGQ